VELRPPAHGRPAPAPAPGAVGDLHHVHRDTAGRAAAGRLDRRARPGAAGGRPRRGERAVGRRDRRTHRRAVRGAAQDPPGRPLRADRRARPVVLARPHPGAGGRHRLVRSHPGRSGTRTGGAGAAPARMRGGARAVRRPRLRGAVAAVRTHQLHRLGAAPEQPHRAGAAAGRRAVARPARLTARRGNRTRTGGNIAMSTTTARDRWLAGHGPIVHRDNTVARIDALVERLQGDGRIASPEAGYALLAAADRLACVAMNVVAHMTYARRIDLSGAPLAADDFKPVPEGHTGGALNMVQGSVGYLLANALTGDTRGWIMGQGHCVAAIEAVNALTGDVSPNQRGRYDRSAEGLSRLIADFYSYAIGADGRPAVPLGSHAGADTAGAASAGGYLGFAGLQYVHMPLPGESVVACLSDGALEEQRGQDRQS